MKRIKLKISRERLRNLTYAETRVPAGGYVNQFEQDPAPDPATDGCGLHAEDHCTDWGSNTITHQRSYQLVNTIC
jgi:hypothetical protein